MSISYSEKSPVYQLESSDLEDFMCETCEFLLGKQCAVRGDCTTWAEIISALDINE